MSRCGHWCVHPWRSSRVLFGWAGAHLADGFVGGQGSDGPPWPLEPHEAHGTNLTWLQDIVRDGMVVATAATSVNDADILTKWVQHDVMEAALGPMVFYHMARSL